MLSCRIVAKDYYELLGVERDASPEQIKKAFRKAALEHHPDRAEDETAAEARFKEINEAYAVLSDPEKRRQYDMFGSDRFHQQFSQEDIFNSASYGSIQDILGDLGIGGDIFSRIFGRFGGRGGRSPDPYAAAPARGQDAESTVTVTFEEAVHGGERQISIGAPNGPKRSLNVKIPAGTMDGTRLRLKGQAGGAPPGDLYLRLQVLPHPHFRRRGNRDLEVEVPIDVLALILGGSTLVPTIAAGNKKVKIQPGTQPGLAIRLRGFGVPLDPPGDLYAIIRARIPQHLTGEQRALLEQLRATGL
jgi:curved DNA-binding protein